MTVEQSPLDRFSNQKQQPPPLLNIEKDAALSPAGVIDLTNDGSEKEDDLKKAIALSLKEHEKVLGGQVSMEDQDISRVIEASLAESKFVGTKRKRDEVWQDPLNPHDRTRNGDWPVGLKNVGNTCWFSAVIQSLFHLPIFRKLVLHYSPKNSSIGQDPKEKRNLVFMQELRKLFALMLCSKRKYVDPSHALEEFKEAFPDSSGTDSQQDVSEFTHKLLEWLEEAFKVDTYQHGVGDNGESMMEGPDQNPMLSLFYGHFLSEGYNGGRVFSNEETFGQFPLQVNGFDNIHESLEAAMAQEIESNDTMSKSGQESWFLQLPPVLLFELSRFQFNQQFGRPEKIHNKLEFPEVMYMDRYMEKNKSTTREIREKVHKLKEERDALQTQLEKYLNYGSGFKKVPLSDALQYTLEFAESRTAVAENTTEDIEMASPSSVSSAGGESPSNSLNRVSLMEVAPHPALSRIGPVPEDAVPSPRHVSEVELRVLQSCLKRWRKEVESNVKNLQDNINHIDTTIKEIYNNSALQMKPYRLHAVLVHEGQAASGHYWAYVYSPTRQMWLKFNDVAVSEATWSELQKDSMGGHHYASAYCLLYVNDLRHELFDESREISIGPEYLCALADDLQQFVEKDNEAFQSETEHWDCEQTRKKDSSTMTVLDTDCTIIAEKRLVLYDSAVASRHDNSLQRPENSSSRSVFQSKPEVKSDSVENNPPSEENKLYPFCSELSKEHACLEYQRTLARVQTFVPNPFHKAEEFFVELLRQEAINIRRLGRMPTADDTRLQHVGVYIVMNSSGADTYLNWCVLEQFLIPELDNLVSGHVIRNLAIKEMSTFRQSLREEQREAYQKWHEEYQLFRKVVTHFIQAVESVEKNADYSRALIEFYHGCKLNSALLKLPGNRRGLDNSMLELYRRTTCLRLNELIAFKFETLETKEAVKSLSDAYEYILSSMEFLTSGSEADAEAAERIRNRWCSMLGHDNLTTAKSERLQDFLSKLLDPSNDMPKLSAAVPMQRFPDLDIRFKSALIKGKEIFFDRLANTHG